jgi:3-dehydroquinate dehydratase-2
MRVLVLNGPNLGRLGRRQPEIYGSTTYAELVTACEEWGRELGLEVEVRQTNHEGALLDWLNTAADDRTPVVLNAGAWTHYSLALYDACAQLSAPLVEVHLSDPTQRPESFPTTWQTDTAVRSRGSACRPAGRVRRTTTCARGWRSTRSRAAPRSASWCSAAWHAHGSSPARGRSTSGRRTT